MQTSTLIYLCVYVRIYVSDCLSVYMFVCMWAFYVRYLNQVHTNTSLCIKPTAKDTVQHTLCTSASSISILAVLLICSAAEPRQMQPGVRHDLVPLFTWDLIFCVQEPHPLRLLGAAVRFKMRFCERSYRKVYVCIMSRTDTFFVYSL